MQARLVVCKHLDGLALAQKNVAQCRILQCIVLLKCILKCVLSSGSCALHQFIDICSADCDRQKSYCGENRETSSDIIRNNESLITFLGCQFLQCSSCLVRCRIDTLCSLCLAVFLLQHLLEDTECDCRLGCRTGFGNDIDREITVADDIHQVCDVGAADAVSCKINFRCLAYRLRSHVVEVMTQELNCRSCSKIRTTDTDYYQYLAVALDLLCCLFDSCELFFIIIRRKVDPSEEIIACSVA